MVRRVKKDSAISQQNPGNEIVVLTGSRSTIPRPQSKPEPTLSSRGRKKYNWCLGREKLLLPLTKVREKMKLGRSLALLEREKNQLRPLIFL
ncbi:hypothetical protein ACH5RR_033646 [Cinchona calisaya]|uniref:Uncharacterized protein n=1 Tax=Cinchona calisaya TaxID=153742 RepID=A0ABD2YC65_9GENT